MFHLKSVIIANLVTFKSELNFYTTTQPQQLQQLLVLLNPVKMELLRQLLVLQELLVFHGRKDLMLILKLLLDVMLTYKEKNIKLDSTSMLPHKQSLFSHIFV